MTILPEPQFTVEDMNKLVELIDKFGHVKLLEVFTKDWLYMINRYAEIDKEMKVRLVLNFTEIINNSRYYEDIKYVPD